MPKDTLGLSDLVFPQDQPDGKAGLARAGGLTKLEYFALQIYVKRGVPVTDQVARTIARRSVDEAKILLEECRNAEQPR